MNKRWFECMHVDWGEVIGTSILCTFIFGFLFVLFGMGPYWGRVESAEKTLERQEQRGRVAEDFYNVGKLQMCKDIVGPTGVIVNGECYLSKNNIAFKVIGFKINEN